MENMIDHHSMAVMMAALCEDRAVHPRLLSQCDRILATQSAEISEMQMWLADWYGIAYEPQMNRKMERQLEEVAGLAGAEFEIAFMDAMIEHHATAIKEGQKCVRKAYHTKLIRLCQSIVKSQQRERVLMQNWLCDWYDLCDEKGNNDEHAGRNDQHDDD